MKELDLAVLAIETKRSLKGEYKNKDKKYLQKCEKKLKKFFAKEKISPEIQAMMTAMIYDPDLKYESFFKGMNDLRDLVLLYAGEFDIYCKDYRNAVLNAAGQLQSMQEKQLKIGNNARGLPMAIR